MEGARSLISAFHELNRSKDNTVAHFTPSLIGMFGSLGIFDAFLAEIDSALANRTTSPSLKKRAVNLSGTFIPQVAEYNGIKDPAAYPVTTADLQSINASTLAGRREGAVIILAALLVILKEIREMG